MEEQAKAQEGQKPAPTNTVLKIHKISQSTGVKKLGAQRPE